MRWCTTTGKYEGCQMVDAAKRESKLGLSLSGELGETETWIHYSKVFTKDASCDHVLHFTHFSHTFCLEALILLLRGWMCKFCARIMGRKLNIVGSIWVKHPQLLISAPCLSLPRKRRGKRKQLVFYFSSPPRLRSISCCPCIPNPPELRNVSKAFFACGCFGL